MELRTWGEQSRFEYNGNVRIGTIIWYGQSGKSTIAVDQWQSLLNEFAGRTVEIGTSKDNPPPGSMGDWFYRNITQTALLPYVGAILLHENLATREGSTITVINRPNDCRQIKDSH